LFKKLTVIGLLSLLAWNVALAKVPLILLCLHDDLQLHLKSDEASGEHCDNTGESHSSNASDCCEIKEVCDDFEITGGALVSAVISNTEVFESPPCICWQSELQLPKGNCPVGIPNFQFTIRGPPNLPNWLTDTYICKIVIRI
jgi:hypothetical protein